MKNLFIVVLASTIIIHGVSLVNYKIIKTRVSMTAYSPSPHITVGDPFTMASGKKAEPEELEQLMYIAVSRDLREKFDIEYGDMIWIGFQVEDTMHKRIKNTVDLFMRNLDLARKFGRQEREIIIIKKGGK